MSIKPKPKPQNEKTSISEEQKPPAVQNKDKKPSTSSALKIDELKITQNAKTYQIHIYSKQKDPIVSTLKVIETATLEQVRTLLPNFKNYNFYKDEKIFLNQYAPIRDVANAANHVILKINNIQQITKEERIKSQIESNLRDITLIKKQDGQQNSNVVKSYNQQKLSDFRQKLSIIKQFKFLKGDQVVLNQVQSQYNISYVLTKRGEKDAVIMVKSQTKSQKEQKVKKILEAQEKQKQKVQKALKDLDNLQKNLIDKKNIQNTKKQIQAKLKQYNQALSLDVTSKQSLTQVKEAFQTQASKIDLKITNAEQYLNGEQSFLTRLEKNGNILAPYYSNQHLSKIQQLRIVNFDETKIQYFQDLQRSKTLNIAIYEKNIKSSARTEMEKLDNYNFIGASVGVGYGPVFAAVEAGHAEISSSQTIKCRKSIIQNQKITQIFYGLCINHAITFLPGYIKLKKEIIDQFQLIVQEYLNKKLSKIKQEQTLNSDTRIEINKFLNKYGDGIQNGIYFLGGVFKDTFNYTFTGQKSAEEFQNIVCKQTKNSVKASISGTTGVVTATVGGTVKQQKSNSTGQKQKVQQSKSGYTCTKSHQSYPLNFVDNLSQWLLALQAIKYHWKLIKIEDKQSIPLKQLLNKSNNQSSMGNARPQFLQARNQIFKLMENIQDRDYFKFALQKSHPNIHGIYFDKTTIGLYQDATNGYITICGDTPFYKNKVHNIQASMIKKFKDDIQQDIFDIIIGVVSGNSYNSTNLELKQHKKQSQDYNSQNAQCIYFSFQDNKIYYGNWKQKEQQNKHVIVHPNPKLKQYKKNDLLNMKVNLIQFKVTFTLNRQLIGEFKIPLTFLKQGLYPFIGFKKADQMLNMSKNLIQTGINQ